MGMIWAKQHLHKTLGMPYVSTRIDNLLGGAETFITPGADGQATIST